MDAPITLYYAAALSLLLLVLSLRIVRLRRRHQVGIGSGGVAELQRAVRVQANFCEYVPLAVVLLALAEASTDLPGGVVHGFGVALLTGRVLHASGLGRSAGATRGRVMGTLLTWLVLGLTAIVAVVAGLLGAASG